MKTWLIEHRYAFGETYARLMRQPLSFLLNLLVVAVALTLPLAGYTVLKNLQPVTSQLVSEPEISVFLALDTKRPDAEKLGLQLRALTGVARADFISRETALSQLKQQAGLSKAIAALSQNPLPDVWILHLKTDSDTNLSALQETLAQQIRRLAHVEYVQIDSAWVQRMQALVHFLKIALVLLAVLLASTIIIVIFNTIRLQVLTQREEIEVATLMGATNHFIRRPFYYSGALQGLLAGVIALGLMYLALIPLNHALTEVTRLYASGFYLRAPDWQDLSLFLGSAGLLGWIGALLSVNRQLGMLTQK